jgi:hypothetical protein
MTRRYYLANCYPRINDEAPREYEERLQRIAETSNFSPRCAVNLHGECGWCEASCRCLCHDDNDADEQLRGRVIELLRPIEGDYPPVPDGFFEETAQQIINLVRSTKK